MFQSRYEVNETYLQDKLTVQCCRALDQAQLIILLGIRDRASKQAGCLMIVKK